MYLNILAIVLLLTSCTSSKEDKPLRWLDDIPYDRKYDKPDFVLCNESQVYQYFNLGYGIHYEGGKPAIINFFMNNYDDSIVKKESGLIRVRFIVNCKGETDRFRMIQSDLAYNKKLFDRKITDQILAITKSMDKWGQKYKDDGTSVDYWQFLVFKIVDGEIKKITP